MSDKKCSKCKHSVLDESKVPPAAYCLWPDPVTGYPCGAMCWGARQLSLVESDDVRWQCGPEAKNFEPKESGE